MIIEKSMPFTKYQSGSKYSAGRSSTFMIIHSKNQAESFELVRYHVEKISSTCALDG
jgi:hypothetical protein